MSFLFRILCIVDLSTIRGRWFSAVSLSVPQVAQATFYKVLLKAVNRYYGEVKVIQDCDRNLLTPVQNNVKEGKVLEITEHCKDQEEL